MINIYEDLADLEAPIYQQGSAPEALPDSFYTIWNNYTGDNTNADNAAKSYEYEWQLIYYTKNYSTIFSGIAAAKTLLKSKGYIVGGLGYDFGGQYKDWAARAIDIAKIEQL